jgi:DNA-binding MarR family transcriptional regulator
VDDATGLDLKPALPSVEADIPFLGAVSSDALLEDNGPADATDAPVAPEATPSLPARIQEAAHQTALSALFALLSTVYAMGLEDLRLLAARPAAALGRVARWLRVLPLLAPLFSRIEQDDVLHNPVRARIHEAIAAEPGLSLRDVSGRAGVAWGTTVFHLRRLERHGLVTSQASGGRRRFFPANSEASRQRAGLSALFHPTARRIAVLVHDEPGIDQKTLCQRLAIQNPSASKHLARFMALGLVLPRRNGRSCRYEPTPELASAVRLIGPAARMGLAPVPVVLAA